MYRVTIRLSRGQLDLTSGDFMTSFTLSHAQVMMAIVHRGRRLDVWCDKDTFGNEFGRRVTGKLPLFETFSLPSRYSLLLL